VTVARVTALIRLILAVTEMVRPRRIIGAVGGSRDEALPAWVVRVLGARITTGSVVSLIWPQRRVLAAAAGVDALHGASMLLVAGASPQYRRLAVVAATEALGAAMLGGWAARRAV
jgi:hypothetical protein